MFKCEICENITKPREKQNKKVLKSRKKYYFGDKYGKEKVKEGSEIVKEINICEKCFKEEK